MIDVVLTEGYLHACNSGGQKVLGLPSDRSKPSDLSLPPQTMNFKQNGWKRAFLGCNIAGARGDEEMNL